MRDFESHKHECQDLKGKGRDQILDRAKVKANVDQVVKTVFAVWEKAFSDSKYDISRKNDGLILKDKDKRSSPINEVD